MKFHHIKSGRLVSVNIRDYTIDWQKDSASKIQTAVKKFFYPFWKNNVVLEEFRLPGCLLRADLINLSTLTAVETNGRQHDTFVKFFQGSRSGYLKGIKSDFQKLEWLEKEGFKVIELVEKDIPLLSPQYIKDKFGIEI